MIKIDKILKEKRLTKTEVATRMNLSRESLYRILSGNPTLENLNKLADALEIKTAELFDPVQVNEFTCPNCGTKLKITCD